jgi:hypothetical protein
VHIRGFIIKKFITMHGHMNVKFVNVKQTKETNQNRKSFISKINLRNSAYTWFYYKEISHDARSHDVKNNSVLHFIQLKMFMCRSQWPDGLRRVSAAARLLTFWVRIPPGAWMSVCFEWCVYQVESFLWI